MFNNSIEIFISHHTNLTQKTSISCNKDFPVVLEVILVGIYVIGIIGNLIAFLHLCRKRNFQNSRHPLMLKCLISNNLVGLIGMLLLHLTRYLPQTLTCIDDIKRWVCIGRVFFRFFGLSSGCVALVMALERFLALTKPFTYQQCITKRLIGKTILCLWTFVFCWTCLPFVGFGLYINEAENKCVNYKEAQETNDIIYAYLMFALGMILCSGIVICNLSVTKVLCKAHFSRRGSTSSLYYQQVKLKHMRRTLFQIASNRPSFNGTVPTSEEIRFAKLMLILSISFVICWCPQMITIILYQILPSSSDGNRFILTKAARLSDFLLLLHFVSDPYIYVLLRNNRHRHTFNVILKKILNKKPSNSSESRNSPENEVVDCNLLEDNENNNIGRQHRSSVVCFSSDIRPAGQTRGMMAFN